MKYDVFSNFLQRVQSRHRSATAAAKARDEQAKKLAKNEGRGTYLGLVIRNNGKELSFEELERHLEVDAKYVRMGNRL